MTLIALEGGFWLDRGPDALNTGRVSIGTRADATLRGVFNATWRVIVPADGTCAATENGLRRVPPAAPNNVFITKFVTS